MQPRDFLDDVDLALDIEPPGWNRHFELIDTLMLGREFETETGQNPQDFFRVQRLSKDAAHFGEAQQDWGLIPPSHDYVDYVTRERPTPGCKNQLGHPVGGDNSRLVVSAALEPVRGVCV